jgi:NhaA family Na+:H+ antiporter
MINKVLTPFQKFAKIESFSGILLLAATLIALLWANSSFGDSYQTFWQYKVGFTSEIFELNKPLILWINDGLMAVFFFLIGLEIKRELMIGELNSVKKIAFPLFGALGGMLIPAIFFLLLNTNPETFKGWGIPMATDIAFSLAILKILGNRVPLSLKIFLTAFAIVDDIGAVLVIAIFYSSNINLELIFYALSILAFLYFMSFKGYYSRFLTLTLGVFVWLLFLKSGIHPTLAGILLAFSIPVRQKINTPEFIENLFNITIKIKNSKASDKPILCNEQIVQIDHLEDWIGKYQSPLQHLEHKLHGWVAYFIIPVFALANAGVVLSSAIELDYALIRNIIICLVIGNSIGISTIILGANKLRLIEIPKDISTLQVIGVSFLAGIGFTMAIFIGGLAFENTPQYIDSAKIGILIGSLVSAFCGYSILRFSGRKTTS